MIAATSRVERVRERALELRRLVVRMAYESQTSHVGGGLSAADVVAALYFDVLRVRPEEPDWPARDRFIAAMAPGTPLLWNTTAEQYPKDAPARQLGRADAQILTSTAPSAARLTVS